MATKAQKKIGYTGGSEGLISGLGKFFLISGIVTSLAFFLISAWTDFTFTAFWGIAGLVTFVQGLILYALCIAFSDVIRILKKQNGINYSGTISEVVPEFAVACSDCDMLVDNTETSCPSCKAAFN